MTDALSRIGQIQSTLQQISGTKTASPTAAASASLSAAATSGSAADFASTLASALGVSTPSTETSILNPGSVTGTDVAAAAQKYLGVPYVFGGEDSSGMDCSGLVQTVYADLGIEVPRLVSGQMTIGTEVGSLAEAQPGDLIVTGGGAHILIYAGDNKVIHAPYPGRDVCLVEAYMTDADIDTIRRVIPSQTASSIAASFNSASLNSASLGSATNGTDMLSAAFASFARGTAS
ncbi:C40 family peptidase [Cryobacterium frigoriphilum]|nr:C40 family peptidase [Cryobacterium frigoriphilum]